MTNAQMTVVKGDDFGDLTKVLEEAGIADTGTLIPLVIPISSLDDIPTVLGNLGQYSEEVTGTIKEAMRDPEEEKRNEVKAMIDDFKADFDRLQERFAELKAMTE